MKQFEIGKVYGEYSVKHEIIARTAKSITYVDVQHIGRPNERKSEPRKAKIEVWGSVEVFSPHDETVSA